jgi:hypothetical protein
VWFSLHLSFLGDRFGNQSIERGENPRIPLFIVREIISQIFLYCHEVGLFLHFGPLEYAVPLDVFSSVRRESKQENHEKCLGGGSKLLSFSHVIDKSHETPELVNVQRHAVPHFLILHHSAKGNIQCIGADRWNL